MVSCKLVLEKDGKSFEVPLGFSELAAFVYDLDGTLESSPLLSLLASHPSSAVRENLASKDDLPVDVLETLSADSNVAVLRSLVSSDAFMDFAEDEHLLRIIAIDVDAAATIAGRIERYTNATRAVSIALANHSDPCVSFALASNYSASKSALRSLLKHPDFKVSKAARETLGR